MDTNEMRYCLAKQLARAHSVQTDYGDFDLDEEMRDAVETALRPILERRLDPGRPVKPHRSGGGHWVGG
jgi:hypothetical protein